MENDTDLLFVFPPAGKGSCLVLETTLPNRGDIPTGFVRGNATGKVKSALPGRCVKACKKQIRYICCFVNKK